jgi:hypothetical protein
MDAKIETGDVYQAFWRNYNVLQRAGYAVINGCNVTIQTGDLGAGADTLQVDDGTVTFDGTEVPVSSGPIDIASSGKSRWDLVTVDDTGSIDVLEGTPQTPQINNEGVAVPSEAKRIQVDQPTPPDLLINRVLLAAIWIPGGASGITSNDRFDWRPDPLYRDTDAISAVESHGSPLTIDITGDADMIDGYEGAQIAILGESETITATWQWGASGSRVAIGGSAIYDAANPTTRRIDVGGSDLTINGSPPLLDATDTIDSDNIASGAVGTGEISDDSIASADIASGAVETSEIAAGAVGSSEISDGSIATGDLANGAVDTAKIANNAIETALIATGAISSTEIQDESITTGDLENDAVDTAKIANNAIETDLVGAGAISSNEIQDGSVQSGDLAFDPVQESELDRNAVADLIERQPQGLPATGLSNATGENSVEEIVVVDSSETFRLWIWACSETPSAGGATPSGLKLQVIDSTDSVVYQAGGAGNGGGVRKEVGDPTASPLASGALYTLSPGSNTSIAVRLQNDTSTDYSSSTGGVGASFGYQVVS